VCGRADAKRVKFGRKPKLTVHQQRQARECIAAGETLGLSERTVRDELAEDPPVGATTNR
jgi:hypothetical protein